MPSKKDLVLNQAQQAIYDNGGVAVAIDMQTYQRVKVCKNSKGAMCLVISTAQAYASVKPYTASAYDLNLTESETKEGMQKHTITCYRSSGYKENDKVLTREQQIAKGVARKIVVCVSLKEHAQKDSNNPNDYDWVIMEDNATLLEEIH